MWKLLTLVVAVAGATLVVVQWGSGGRSGDPPRATPVAPLPPTGSADYILQAGELAAIDLAALPAERPISFHLMLPEPSRDTGPLRAQLRDTAGRSLDLLASVDVDERLTARIEITPGWLTAGSYVVELHTTERSHFPIRRYPIEVR